MARNIVELEEILSVYEIYSIAVLEGKSLHIVNKGTRYEEPEVSIKIGYSTSHGASSCDVEINFRRTIKVRLTSIGSQNPIYYGVSSCADYQFIRDWVYALEDIYGKALPDWVYDSLDSYRLEYDIIRKLSDEITAEINKEIKEIVKDLLDISANTVPWMNTPESTVDGE